MTMWRRDETEFPMAIISGGKANSQHVNVPPAIREALGNPTHIKFVIRRGKVHVEGLNK